MLMNGTNVPIKEINGSTLLPLPYEDTALGAILKVEHETLSSTEVWLGHEDGWEPSPPPTV